MDKTHKDHFTVTVPNRTLSMSNNQKALERKNAIVLNIQSESLPFFITE